MTGPSKKSSTKQLQEKEEVKQAPSAGKKRAARDQEPAAQMVNDVAPKKRSKVTQETKTSPAFLEKLFEILQAAKHTELIRWSDDGLSFEVLDKKKFASQLLTQYFKHGNMDSFVR